MSARAFSGFGRQFARGVRFQRMNIPKAVPKMWKADEMMYQTLRGAKLTAQMDSKMIRSTLNRMRCIEMKRIQIGALYMFSYVSKDFLEILKHFEEMLDSEDEDEMEERTTLTGRLQS
ncbi:hypothetical protein WA577_002318 [Blastocystis sp. JDR]